MRYVMIFFLVLIAACQSTGTRLVVSDEAGAINPWEGLNDEAIYAKAAQYIKDEKPQHAVDGFTLIAEKYPTSPRYVDALLSMGKIYTDQFREYSNGVTSFKKVVNLYPDSSVTAQAYFMLGFIHANYDIKLDEARKYYETFLKKYPSHELASSVQFELSNLGMNADEILKTSLPDSLGVETDSAATK
jgi:TolA-binding protein